MSDIAVHGIKIVVGEERRLALDIARDFVREQAQGEWDDEMIERDAVRIADIMKEFTANAVVFPDPSESTKKLSLDGVIERLKEWPRTSPGDDAMSASYVGGLMERAAHFLESQWGELRDLHDIEAAYVRSQREPERAHIPDRCYPTMMVCVVPAGWALVPKEPTEFMLIAGATRNTDADQEGAIFAAMCSAAPQPPLPAHPFSDVLPLPSGPTLLSLVKELKRADIGVDREKLADLCGQAVIAIQLQQAFLDKCRQQRLIPMEGAE